jgi:hypothetical protein
MSELMQGIGPRTVQQVQSVRLITSAAAIISAGLTAVFALWAASGHNEVVLTAAKASPTTGAAPVATGTDELEVDREIAVPVFVSPSAQAPIQAKPTLRPAPAAPKAAPPATSKPVAATAPS